MRSAGRLRKGGARELFLREALTESQSSSVLAEARRLLVARRETDGLFLLDRCPFSLCVGSNGFGDSFLVLVAWVSPERLSAFREELAGPTGGSLRQAAAALRSTVGDAAAEDAREVRFVALAVGDKVVQGQLGEYRYGEEFDRGAFASIHRATSDGGALLALKRLIALDNEAVARFRREIEEQSRICHPCVMTPHFAGS